MPPERAWTRLAWLGAVACVCLVGQVAAGPRPATLASACDPAGAAIVVDDLLRCDPVVACDGGVVRSGDAFTGAGACAARIGRMSADDLEALAVPIDLATATLADLESLPGIGPELARRIAAARPYHAIDDLLRVDGIGPVRLAAIRPRVRVVTP
jgi:hypothetical protein